MTAQAISTERLLLRRWKPRDYAPFAEMCADPEVMRFIGSGAIMTGDQVAADIEKYEASWEADGYGQFAVELKRTGTFIGFAGLGVFALLPEYASFTEIGWRFTRKCWGNGYATEAAKAVMAFAQKNRGLDNIVGVCQTQNVASERVMQKIGMSLERDSIAPNNGRSIRIYTLKKPEISAV
ncbi:MAG: GNAT family N-acetyltransferase [Pseudomonadota bacterium]